MSQGALVLFEMLCLAKYVKKNCFHCTEYIKIQLPR